MPLPITIAGDRIKAFRLVLLGIVMTGASWFMLATGGPVAIGMAGLAFFGFGTLALLTQVVRPPMLSVTVEGIALRSLRSWRMSWAEVAGVRLVLRERSTFVMIDYRESARPPMMFGRRRQGRLVPNTLRLPPDEIRVLLFDALRAARAGSAEPDEPIPSAAPEPIPPPRWAIPWVSLALAVVLSLVFAAEIRFPVSPATGDLTPSDLTLTGFGASSRALTLGQGEWYRALLAPVLHANLGHLLGNVWALLWGGWLLEKLVGRAWFGAIYAVGALAGELVSMIFNPADTIDVGASGAIMALFAATYALSFHYRGSSLQARLQGRATGILAPALFTIGKSTAGGGLHINVAAHAGGAAAGAVLGLLLLRQWPREARHPGGYRIGAVVAGLGCAAVLAAIGPAVSDHRALSGIAAGQLALEAGDIGRASDDVEFFLARRPNDAEGWIFKGTLALARSDPRAAVTDFGTAYRLRPTPGTLGLRGLAAFYAGELAAALSDLQEAAANGGGLYSAIWLDMIRERQGLGPSLAPGDLAGAAHDWPWPVAEMFAGAITPDQLLSQAARSRKSPSVDEVCEADTYIAEWGLTARHRREDTRERFSKALKECPATFFEALIARLELARDEDAP